MKHFISVLFCSLLANGLSAAEPLDIGFGRQLFLDDFIVERLAAAQAEVILPRTYESKSFAGGFQPSSQT